MAAFGDLACQEFVELVTDYLEGTLPADLRARFDAHLAECDWCVEYLAQIQQTIHTLGRLSEEDIPPPARDRLLDVFRDWKRAPDFAL